MKHAFEPVERQSLSDRLARQIRHSVQGGDFRRGDRLPPIMEMARRFGVGHPTIREALKKLEAMGVVEIRHGSGVYVSRSEEVLVLAAPDYSGTLTKKLLLDLIRARTPLEMQSASDAARNASAEDIRDMQRQLALAGENLHNDEELSSLGMGFHYQVARSSGNMVLAQILGALYALFMNEQRLILDIFGSRERDHTEHLGILAAIELRDEALAIERMRKHLGGVLGAIEQWDPDHHPVT